MSMERENTAPESQNIPGVNNDLEVSLSNVVGSISALKDNVNRGQDFLAMTSAYLAHINENYAHNYTNPASNAHAAEGYAPTADMLADDSTESESGSECDSADEYSFGMSL
jgi:hypothetical protein